MRNKYFKYICLLSLGVFCYSCSDDNTENVGGGSGEGEQGTEQEIVRSYKLGTLAGFEGDLRTKMDIPFTQSTVMYNRSLFYRYIASAYPDQIAPEPPATPKAEEPKKQVYPSPITEADWWDNFVEEIAYSGQDYVAMNCRGEASGVDHGRPALLPKMIEAIQRKGLENKFKIAIFDDTPASWSAARNAALGYGYDSKPFKDGTRVEGSHYPLLFLDPEKEDQKGPGNEFRKEIYYYIWDTNLKPAFENMPRDYWFEINGRPVIFFWNPNGFLQDSYLGELMTKYPDKYVSTTGLDHTKADAYNGKLSYILKCISDDFNTEFGVRPFLIVQREWTDRDYSLVDCPYLDGIHNWFAVPTMDMSEDVYNENLIYNTYIPSYNFKGFKVGSGCPGFVQGDRSRPNYQLIDADHGKFATKMFESFLNMKPDLVFLEGFTDVAENAAWWRSKDRTYYDYPNQRINLLRKYGNHPFPMEQRLEAEACDFCYKGTVSGNKIETSLTEQEMTNAPEQFVVKRCEDSKYSGGWHTNLTAEGLNTLKWKELPFRSGQNTIRFRYSSNTVAAISCLIGDTMTKSISLPATGGTWEEAEVAIYSRDTRGYADFNLIVSEGDISLNYVEIIAEK